MAQKGIFQSTLSVRRVTLLVSMIFSQVGISIHTLREESDGIGSSSQARHRYFNPHSSVRRVTPNY